MAHNPCHCQVKVKVYFRCLMMWDTLHRAVFFPSCTIHVAHWVSVIGRDLHIRPLIEQISNLWGYSWSSLPFLSISSFISISPRSLSLLTVYLSIVLLPLCLQMSVTAFLHFCCFPFSVSLHCPPTQSMAVRNISFIFSSSHSIIQFTIVHFFPEFSLLSFDIYQTIIVLPPLSLSLWAGRVNGKLLWLMFTFLFRHGLIWCLNSY